MKFCTISTLSHMHRTKVMALSLKRHYPEATLILCLVEQTNELDRATRACFDDVVLAKDFGIPNFQSIMFGYEVREATCSLKGDLLEYMFNRYPEEIDFIYVDSDIKFFSRMDEIEGILNNYSLVVTPHVLRNPHSDFVDFWGIYNTGFIALRRSKEGYQFLEWWKDKLRYQCYIDREKGIFLDQSWLNVVPSFINTYVMYHPGYNISFWNLHEAERRFTSFDQRHMFSSGARVIFFHFSCLTNEFMGFANNPEYDPSGVVRHYVYEYLNDLESTGLMHKVNSSWSYAYYYDGSKIDPDVKRKYRQAVELHASGFDPYLGYEKRVRKTNKSIHPIVHPRKTKPSTVGHAIKNPRQSVKQKVVSKRKLRVKKKIKSRNKRNPLQFRKILTPKINRKRIRRAINKIWRIQTKRKKNKVLYWAVPQKKPQSKRTQSSMIVYRNRIKARIKAS